MLLPAFAITNWVLEVNAMYSFVAIASDSKSVQHQLY